jgi:hypothetical protein
MTFHASSIVKSALAQIQYPFETTYTSETSLVPITANILRITSEAQNDKAPSFRHLRIMKFSTNFNYILAPINYVKQYN